MVQSQRAKRLALLSAEGDCMRQKGTGHIRCCSRRFQAREQNAEERQKHRSMTCRWNAICSIEKCLLNVLEWSWQWCAYEEPLCPLNHMEQGTRIALLPSWSDKNSTYAFEKAVGSYRKVARGKWEARMMSSKLTGVLAQGKLPSWEINRARDSY